MPLITISRNIACGGEAIARRVAEKLSLEFYDDQRLQEEAVRMGIRSEDLKSLDEKAPGLFDRILNKKPELYFEFMESVVYQVAKQDKGVILGHGSQLLLRDFGCALHVLIHSDASARVRKLMDGQHISRNVAENLIRKKDNEQKGFFQFAFHMDWNDPSLYDLIINTGKLGEDFAVSLIAETAKSDEVAACSMTALSAMDRLSREKKIQAILLKNDISLAMLHIEVSEDGGAYVGGVVPTKEEKDRIAKVVSELTDISEIRTEVSVMPAGV